MWLFPYNVQPFVTVCLLEVFMQLAHIQGILLHIANSILVKKKRILYRTVKVGLLSLLGRFVCYLFCLFITYITLCLRYVSDTSWWSP